MVGAATFEDSEDALIGELLRSCEARIWRIGRCLRLQRRRNMRCGSDGFAQFALRTFARALSGDVEVTAHGVTSTANQVSILCRFDSVTPTRARPSRRSRSSASESREELTCREHNAEISVRVIPFGLAVLNACRMVSATSFPTRSTNIWVALCSQKSQTASAASRWAVSICVLLSSAT